MQGAGRSLVKGVDVRFDPVQVHPLEAEADERPQRLVHVAAAPGPGSRRVAEFGAAATGGQIEQGALPDYAFLFASLDREGEVVAVFERGHAPCGEIVGLVQ